MNAWNPPTFDAGRRRARELDELLKLPNCPPGRAQVARSQRQSQHERRIAYLRRGGRYDEATAEIAAHAAREAFTESQARIAARKLREMR